MKPIQLGAGRRIRFVSEGDLASSQERAIAGLLDKCFPGAFEDRTYFKQLPHARLLLFEEDRIIGQIGADLRVVRVGESLLRTVGLIDLCVDAPLRRQGLGTALLEAAAARAAAWHAEFILLFADRPDIYVRNGYAAIRPAEVCWLAIEDRASHSLVQRDMSGTLMVKALAGRQWPPGTLDLLGYLF